MAGQFFLNTEARDDPDYRGLFSLDECAAVQDFFQKRADLQATPLRNLRALAAQLGLKNIFVKDESVRFGMDAFKITGVTYAMDRLISEGRLAKGSVVLCATEGNHGKAVARASREFEVAVKIFVSSAMTAERVAILRREGAEVIVVDGSYDDAVKLAAQESARAGWTVVSDSAWPGYEEIPRMIMAGYTRIMHEAERQWGHEPPDIVLVQAGVGGLAGAVVSWLCLRYGTSRPFTIVCEPTSAASFLASAREGTTVSINGPFNTIMSGLRSGETSSIAAPAISKADAFIAVDDDQCIAAMKALAHPNDEDPVVTAGPSGACGVAALLSLCQDESLRQLRDASGLNAQSRVFVINTEGATDPELYERVISQ